MVGDRLPPPHFYDLKDDDVFWCTSDIGWVVGHSYIVYAPAGGGHHHRRPRGRHRLPRSGDRLAGGGEAQGERHLHRAHGAPDVHEVRRRATREVRPLLAPAHHRAPASRSTPRPAAGRSSTSSTTASGASSPTTGGRPSSADRRWGRRCASPPARGRWACRCRGWTRWWWTPTARKCRKGRAGCSRSGGPSLT